VNQDRFWFTSCPRNSHKNFLTSYMDLLLDQPSIHLVPSSLFVQRRLFVCLIYWSLNK